MKPNHLRNRLILFGILLVIAFILLLIGVTEAEGQTRYYSLPDQDTPILRYDDYKYYLNDIQLELIEKPWLESLKGMWDRNLPVFPYIVGAILCLPAIIYIWCKLPPPLMWGNILRAGKEKQDCEGIISLTQAPGGVIALRGWDVNKQGVLRSVSTGTEWETAVLEADVKPEVKGWHGIYAYRLGTDNDVGGNVAGIVSLSSCVVGHRDSLLRAQKCTILLLITHREKVVELLKKRYKCPVIVAKNIKQVLCQWVVGDEGIFWLGHNNRLINRKIQEGISQEIAEMPVYKDFQTEV